MPAGSATFAVVEHVAQTITSASGGRLVVEPFPQGAIVEATKELEGTHRGEIEAAFCAHEHARYLFPAAGLLGATTGGLGGFQRMMWFRVGGGDELAARVYEPLDVVYVSSPLYSVPEIFFHTNKEIKTVADMKGLKMRCSGEGAEILANMGVATVFLPGSELYESMQRGVIDAFEYGSFDLNWGMSFHEVAKYIYLSPTRAPGGCYAFYVNKDAWAKITPDLQSIVEQVTHADVVRNFGEQVLLDQVALAKYIDYGTIISKLPKEIEDEVIRLANEYYDEKAAADPLYSEVLKSQLEFKEICELQNIR